jgi:hypothetical protein
MKKQTVSLITILTTTFLLSACNSQENPAPTTANQQVSNTITTSAADQAAYEGALQLMDANFCDKISDENLKANCRSNIYSKNVQKEAVKNLNPQICDQITDEDQSAACKIAVEVAQKQAENRTPIEQTDMEIFQEANNSLDKTKCDKIKNKDYRESCISQTENLKNGVKAPPSGLQ